MAQAYLSRPGPAAASDQPGMGYGIVWRAKWSLPNERGILRKQPAHTVNLGDLQGLLYIHLGQNRRQRARQQGLATPRRAAHNQDADTAGEAEIVASRQERNRHIEYL